MKFHDGEPLDASVVKFSLDRLFAADSTNPAKSLYTDIDKVEVVDPSTVKVTLKSPNSFLLYSLSLGDAGDHASQVGGRPTTRTRSAPAPSCSRSARRAIRSPW